MSAPLATPRVAELGGRCFAVPAGSVIIKAQRSGSQELRRRTVDNAANMGLCALRQLLLGMFHLESTTLFTLSYVDDEKDIITIRCDDDVEEAIRGAVACPRPVLRLELAAIVHGAIGEAAGMTDLQRDDVDEQAVARAAEQAAAALEAADAEAEEDARIAAEEAAQIAADRQEEAARIAEFEDLQQALQQQESTRVAAEQEAARIAAEQEAARIAAEQEAARIAAEQEAARIAAEQEAAHIAAEQEAARIAAEQEVARIAAEQEAARIAAEQEAARIAAEQEAARIAAEQEAARIAAEQEAARAIAENSIPLEWQCGVQALVDMGFAHDTAREAIMRTEGDVDAALEAALTQHEAPAIENPECISPVPNPAIPGWDDTWNSSVMDLEAMGFTNTDANKKLLAANNGDVESTISELLK